MRRNKQPNPKEFSAAETKQKKQYQEKNTEKKITWGRKRKTSSSK